jgi:uncharacterized membrane protein HdeD (DUF308 family)
MNTPLQTVAKRATGFSIFLSILLIVCGILAILLPIEMSIGVVILLSWLLMIAGVFLFIHAFRSHGVGHILWKIVVALAYFSIGLFLRMNPGIGLATLTFALIMFLVAEGVIDIIFYFRTRSAGASGWLLFDGIVTLILGIMIWRHWPTGSLWVIGFLVGINMIMTGTTRLMLSLAARRGLKAIAGTA